MKKTGILMILLVSLLFLASCKEEAPTDYDVRIVYEEVQSDSIDVHVVIDEKVDALELLTEVSLKVSAMTYEKHQEAIGFDQVTLTIYLYESDDAYDNENPTYGHQVFEINKNAQSPGISLGENELSID